MAKEHPIKRLREHLEMTQEEFAEAVGMSQGRVSQVENGAGISLRNALEIVDTYKRECRRLGISYRDFIG